MAILIRYSTKVFRISCTDWYFAKEHNRSFISWIVFNFCIGTRVHQRLSSPVQSTPEEFQKGASTKCFHSESPGGRRNEKKKKKPTVNAYFDFAFEENSVIVCESSVFKMYSVHAKTKSRRHRFWKAPLSNCIRSTRKRKHDVFKFLRRVFEKLR